MKPLAIISLGPETHDLAPWEGGWECWGLAWDAYAPRCDLVFDPHDDIERLAEKTSRYREIGIPIYLNQVNPEIPLSRQYPLDAVKDLVGDYFGSTVAYMLALAIYQRRKRVGLWGVDLSDDIYDHHRPNLEYLIGFARGRGIIVDLPEGSRLLSYDGTLYPTHYPVRYGWAA